eukprot:scaffold13716_cov122-Isochrysis_galbana.AAC.2
MTLNDDKGGCEYTGEGGCECSSANVSGGQQTKLLMFAMESRPCMAPSRANPFRSIPSGHSAPDGPVLNCDTHRGMKNVRKVHRARVK